MHLLMKTKVVSSYLGLLTRVLNLKKCKKVILGSVWTSPTWGPPPKSENSSTLGFQYTSLKIMRNCLLDTIQEPMKRGFQNTPYFSQSDISSTFGGCSNNVQFGYIFRKFLNFGQPPNVPELSL